MTVVLGLRMPRCRSSRKVPAPPRPPT